MPRGSGNAYSRAPAYSAGPEAAKRGLLPTVSLGCFTKALPPTRSSALTFTNKAADEMSRRIERLANDPSVWVGTFHRFCARLLRKYAKIGGASGKLHNL